MSEDKHKEIENNKYPNPKADIEALDENLRIAQSNYTKAAVDIGYQREIIRVIIKPVYGTVELSGNSPLVFASSASVIHDWSVQSETWRRQSEEHSTGIVLLSSTATSLAYNAVPISSLSGQFINVETVYKTANRRTQTNFVEKELSLIDQSLANVYQQVFQDIYLPAFDPGRGPLLLMRQVFDHLLNKLAPDVDVTSQPGFVPNAELVKQGKNGITRPHRIQYVASKIKDTNNHQLILDSITSFLDTYNELNEAHNRGALNEEAARSAVYSGNEILALWLQAMK
jgi:hypothetical protein